MFIRHARIVCCWALAALSIDAVSQPVVEVQASGGIALAAIPVAPEMSWLRDIVLQVLLRQPELAQASAENRVSRARWNEARAGVLPQLGLSASVGQENQYLEARTNRFKDQHSMQLRVTQPLYDAGITARARQARAMTWGADWSMVQVREQVMVRTVELYAELVRQSRLTELARDNLKLHRQYVGQMKDVARVDLGRASDLPVAQSRVALAESVLTSRLQRLEQARILWRAHTNLPSPEESAVGPLATVLRDLPMVDLPLSVELAVQDAISVHPLLQKSLADLVSAQESIGVAGAAARPRIGAELINRQGSNYGGIFGDQRTLYAGVNLQWNFAVPDLFSQRAASENMRAAQEAVDTQALRVRSTVESQWYELKAAEAALLSYQVYAEQALSVSQSYAEQFRIGRRSLLDVLNAENELFTARSNALTTKIDAQLAQWRLTSLRGLLAEELGL
jgi:adhesin transport system outer membrane protein